MEATLESSLSVSDGAAFLIGECGVLVQFAFDRNTIDAGGIDASSFAHVSDAVAAQTLAMEKHAARLEMNDEDSVDGAFSKLSLNETLENMRRSVQIVADIVDVARRAHELFVEDVHGLALRTAVDRAAAAKRYVLLHELKARNAPTILNERTAAPVLRSMEIAADDAASAYHESVVARAHDLEEKFAGVKGRAGRILEAEQISMLEEAAKAVQKVAQRHKVLASLCLPRV
jgi:hypothetical protein